MPTPVLTADEIIATLNRTSRPTVLCEGETDAAAIRYIEDVLGPLKASFLPCGGRDTLLAVFDRRGEILGLKIVFLADQDTWIFTGTPPQYADILFTWGYSIENDLLDQTGIDRLLTENERRNYTAALMEVVRWYAFEIDKLTRGELPMVGCHVNRVLDPATDTLSDNLKAQIDFKEPPSALLKRISENAAQLLRGKSLIQLLCRFLSAPARASKYQYHNIYEICIKLVRNSRTDRLITEISTRLAV